jgi:hemerythrin superfamily protein
MILFSALFALILTSCRTRVEPNHYGVLMENFGKNGKADYSLQSGRVADWQRHTKLFQVPAWEQRAKFEVPMNLEAADKTAFTSTPSYSYYIMKNRAVDVVFNNAQLDNDKFMEALENNVLETRVYDIMKDISRKYPTDTLMATGGNMRYEVEVRRLVENAFDSIGVHLVTFTSPLTPTNKVKEKIDARNEVNTKLSVLDQQIVEQRKRNELALLKAEENKILSSGITPQLLQRDFIDKWDGRTPIYGTMPVTLFKNVQ